MPEFGCYSLGGKGGSTPDTPSIRDGQREACRPCVPGLPDTDVGGRAAPHHRSASRTNVFSDIFEKGTHSAGAGVF